MAGRKLTQQQAERVRANQQRRVDRLRQRDDRFDDATLGPEQQGLVIARYGSRADVEPLAGGTVQRCKLRANLDSVVTGDAVVFRVDTADGGGVVTARLPRRTELQRPDNYGKLRTIAANIDQVLVVFAPLPAPSSMLLDRYLCACEVAGFRPVLVLNKCDLADNEHFAEAQRLAALYAGIGYDVLQVSPRNGTGMTALNDMLRTHTSILVGQSGVGKSSLVNALLPDAALLTQEVSEGSGLGQHTTTTAQLFHLPGGGALVDSPGVREFQLWHVDEQQLEDSFRDIAALRGSCRFRDCRHLREPACGLRTAVDEGRLHAERLANFLAIRAALQEGNTR